MDNKIKEQEEPSKEEPSEEDIMLYLKEAELNEDSSSSSSRDEDEISEEDIEDNKELIDPLFDAKNSRNTLFPLDSRFKDLWQMYLKAKASFWTPEEIDLSEDLKDWIKLSVDEQHFIKTILAFFLSFDILVNENLDDNFVENVAILEARFFYHFQEMMEDIHSHTYSLLFDTFVSDEEEKKKLLNAIKDVESIKKMADWFRDYRINGNLIERLVASAIVEGIMFSGAFLCIFWLKHKGKLPGLTFSNELISRDEGMHYDFGGLCYNTVIINHLPLSKVEQMVEEGLNLSKGLMKEGLKVDLIGINSNMMNQYLEFITDRFLMIFNGKRVYNSTNPFPWMEMISLQNKANFFEKRVGNYSRQAVLIDSEEQQIRFDIDF